MGLNFSRLRWRPGAILIALCVSVGFGQAQASPPPPVTDSCSALRLLNLSTLGDGAAAMPTKVTAASMSVGYQLTADQTKQVARRSRAMGASIDDSISQ
ncbi:MAG: hypothetical protein JNL55_35990, partial [Steroidobacter sp.]|nr:hypothetical protein [Steroidobacter sp.]